MLELSAAAALLPVLPEPPTLCPTLLKPEQEAALKNELKSIWALDGQGLGTALGEVTYETQPCF